jgi:all-trans-8'-apo-beta-carotenal 15,15'-oxygenase
VTENSTATIADLAPGLESCFLFEETEESYVVSSVSGSLPTWLRGSWYVNGPARFERAGHRYRHWLDGDGMVCSLRLTDEGVRFTNRFVRTRKLIEEDLAGRFLYRTFGTSFSGDRLRRNVMLESPVNVSVYAYAGRLLAMGEQTLPYELDPLTLETLGEYDFEGALNEISPFSAHAKCDSGLINFGVSFSATQPMLNVYEFDAAGALLRRRRYPLRFQHSIHDFGFTPRHVAFFLSPLLMNFQRFWRDRVSVMESLTWEPELGSRILVAPRVGCDEEPFTVEAGGGYCLHVINCFESGPCLVMDILLLDSPIYSEYQLVPDLFTDVPRCRPVRYLIHLQSRTLVETYAMDYGQAPDFPAVDVTRGGRTYKDFWMLGMSARGNPGRKFFDQLAHGSWESGGVSDIYQAPHGEYLGGEPCFIANPADREEGIIICEHLKPAEKATAIALFDASNVCGGPTASIPLRYPIHPGFHATFVPMAEGVPNALRGEQQ